MSTRTKTKCCITYTSLFNKQLKKAVRQEKNISKLEEIINRLANKENLESKYRDHLLVDNKYYKGCRECHIEPNWLLIYKYKDNELVLLLFAVGTHSELF